MLQFEEEISYLHHEERWEVWPAGPGAFGVL